MADGAAIVIVEDEFIVALDIQRYLERNGYSVRGILPSGEEFLERVEELDPDLVLMDIKLQGKLDGVETAARLADIRAVPVILLTAYADETTLSRAKITQPFGYLLKPFNEQELRTSIEIALYRAMMERRLRESERLMRQAQKNGGGRSSGRRHSPRLQQHSNGDPRVRQPHGRGGAGERPAFGGCRRGQEGGQARGSFNPTAPYIFQTPAHGA